MIFWPWDWSGLVEIANKGTRISISKKIEMRNRFKTTTIPLGYCKYIISPVITNDYLQVLINQTYHITNNMLLDVKWVCIGIADKCLICTSASDQHSFFFKKSNVRVIRKCYFCGNALMWIIPFRPLTWKCQCAYTSHEMPFNKFQLNLNETTTSSIGENAFGNIFCIMSAIFQSVSRIDTGSVLVHWGICMYAVSPADFLSWEEGQGSNIHIFMSET